MTRSGLGLTALVVAALLAVSGTGVALAMFEGGGGPPERALPTPSEQIRADAARFLDTYVAADGRVVRHDEGGDTVSEGQAYAMLVSAAVGDRDRFELIWAWTAAHLLRPDGLLSWRWSAGAVVDAEPAADADLDAAWALAIAARRWPDAPYRDDAAALAAAVGLHETVTLDGGRRLLVAGPWAKGDRNAGTSAVVNPSYASPVAEAVLAGDGRASGDVARDRARTSRAVIVRLLDAGNTPPDWAEVRADGAVQALERPGEPGRGRFGFDAVRVPVRYASSCEPADRAVAARIWAPMEVGAGVDALGEHPARLVGAAAAAAAAGEHERAVELLDRASATEPTTYYGAALTAVARILLTSSLLGGCPPLAGR